MASKVFESLASSVGRPDEQPNIELAIKIAKSGNTAHVAELIELLSHSKTAVRHDAIKVLYEIGDRKAELIAPYLKNFIAGLSHKDNRMKWGAMSALSAISQAKPELLGPHMVTIVKAMDEGSVITRDHGVYILRNLASVKKYHNDCMELLLEQIEHAPVNQVPMYAEKTAEVVSAPYRAKLVQAIRTRTDVFEIPSKAKRLDKVIKVLVS